MKIEFTEQEVERLAKHHHAFTTMPSRASWPMLDHEAKIHFRNAMRETLSLIGTPEPQQTRIWTTFKRGEFVVFNNAPGGIIQTDNPKFDTNGVLLIVRVSQNTTGVEVTDENGVHGIVDRMSLQHTPFVSKMS
jgi:hypothetical protein